MRKQFPVYAGPVSRAASARRDGGLVHAYFDTNVYGLIARDGSTADVRRLLRRMRVIVRGSSHNLLETFRAPLEHRVPRIEAIVALARVKEIEPSHYRIALEIRDEIRRRRPAWLVSKPDLRGTRLLLRQYRQLWVEVTTDHHYLPPSPVLLGESAAYLIRSQKARRARELAVGRERLELLRELQERHQAHLDRMEKDEAYWRTASAVNWWASLHDDRPLDDYRDWLAPYVDTRRINSDDWATLWIREIQPVRDRLLRFVEYLQTESRVDAGNFEDLLHASYMLDVDVLVTSDVRFHYYLSELARQSWMKNSAIPMLLAVDARSAVTDLERGLIDVKARVQAM